MTVGGRVGSESVRELRETRKELAGPVMDVVRFTSRSSACATDYEGMEGVCEFPHLLILVWILKTLLPSINILEQTP